jgi:hypothetical protein
VGNANHVRNKTKKIVSGIEKVQCDLWVVQAVVHLMPHLTDECCDFL